MAAPTQNFLWGQGEDLNVVLRYKEGATEETAVTIDLSTGYEVRMDIVASDDRARLYTFNSAALADVDPGAGTVPDNTVETVLTNGAGNEPNINITVPRSLTLPGGPVYERMAGNPPLTTFFYDIFLRNTNTNKQHKILTGTITIEGSYTLWL